MRVRACRRSRLLARLRTLRAGAGRQANAGNAAASTVPAAPAKFVPLVKGTAQVQYIPGASKRVGKDVVTVFKVRTSPPPRSGCSGSTSFGTSGSASKSAATPSRQADPARRGRRGHAQSPYKDGLCAEPGDMFSHVNGQVDPKKVKAFN